MGAAASVVTKDEVKDYPQYHILGGDAKFEELQEEGKVDLGKVHDPYLLYGGGYKGDHKDTKDFKYITFDSLPAFTSHHKSLMSKVLTAEMFDKLKDVRSAKGYTLSNVIMTGVVTPHLGVGATAGDEECWSLFQDLFYPIIQAWHNYNPLIQTQPIDLDPYKLRINDAQLALLNEYVASTRIRAARNIAGFALEQPLKTERILRQCFSNLKGELQGEYFELGKLSPEQTHFLLEKGYLFQIPSARNLLTGAGAARNWPDNRGIFYNANQTALCWVNEEDHCRIISMQDGGDIGAVFKRFCDLSGALSAAAADNYTNLMWNEKLGFLGTCPSNLGTGLRASVMIKLPHFNRLMEGHHHEDKLLLEEVCSAYDLQPRGSAGEHSAAVGAKFDISNKQRMGFSEVQLVQKMIDGVLQVIHYEQMLASGETAMAVRHAIERDLGRKALRVIFLGPPGSGKGTQAPLIRQLFRLAHLSTGDMLRDAVAKETAHGKKAKALMDEGHLVNDEIVVDIVQDAIRSDDCKRGFILDGFPRTVKQAELLDEMLAKHNNHAIDCVISLSVDDELLVQRVTGRLIHLPSGRSYHPVFNPPKREGLDDETNEPLVKRDDDTEEKLRTRLHAFHEKTAPVLQHYKDRVVHIPADDAVQQIAERVREALSKIVQQKMAEH